mmetsp:Transcript_38649/g.77953  ORF Transcript_38649/g.77953 Transcript_38649/m.77953 type:complete len:303 (+) Transcript_38649:542-1450(+)
MSGSDLRLPSALSSVRSSRRWLTRDEHGHPRRHRRCRQLPTRPPLLSKEEARLVLVAPLLDSMGPTIFLLPLPVRFAFPSPGAPPAFLRLAGLCSALCPPRLPLCPLPPPKSQPSCCCCCCCCCRQPRCPPRAFRLAAGASTRVEPREPGPPRLTVAWWQVQPPTGPQPLPLASAGSWRRRVCPLDRSGPLAALWPCGATWVRRTCTSQTLPPTCLRHSKYTTQGPPPRPFQPSLRRATFLRYFRGVRLRGRWLLLCAMTLQHRICRYQKLGHKCLQRSTHTPVGSRKYHPPYLVAGGGQRL